jgi:acetolactate synthase I/II/III large subunit
MKEAFHIATTGRPGPVLVDMPKDIQLEKAAARLGRADEPAGLRDSIPPPRQPEQIKQVAAAIKLAKRPVILCRRRRHLGRRQRRTARVRPKTGIPVTMTVMGLGAFPATIRCRWTCWACTAACTPTGRPRLRPAAGLRRAVRRPRDGQAGGVRQARQDRHIDIDPSELNKNKPAHIPIVSDVKYALQELNKIVEPPEDRPGSSSASSGRRSDPFKYDQRFDGILQQHAIANCREADPGPRHDHRVGVGQHQMWAAQFYKFRSRARWLSSSGLGTMGFGLPAAMGVQAAHPDALVIDIDGDGSFQMNIQELATCYCEKLPVKVLLLNNQHLGMVVQWEDRFMAGNRAHTYLGPIDHAEASGQGRRAFTRRTLSRLRHHRQGLRLRRRDVRKKADLAAGLGGDDQLPGPYVLDVQCPTRSTCCR